MNQERVQFFNSQSSFGSQSSLASSRYFDLTNQIAQQTQTVFATLRKQFLPTKQLTNFDKIQYLNNRAKIICNDTIPDHLQYLDKITAPKQSKQVCRKCSQQLKKLMKDLQSLKNGSMLHKQFYNIYGRSNQDNIFFKKDHADLVTSNNQNNHHMLQPDVVQIFHPRTSRVKNSLVEYNVSARGLATNISSNITRDKQLRELHQQIGRMKKRQQQLNKKFDENLTNQKINCEKRIKIFLNSIADLDKKPSLDANLELLNNYKNQMTILRNSLQSVLQQKQFAITKNKQLEERLQSIQRYNQSLKQQLAGYKKLQNSRMSQLQDQMNRSVHSVHSEYNNDSASNPKKNQNAIKKLTAERDILRSQLAKQRQKLHKQQLRAQQDQSKELIRLKKYLQQRNQQNEQLKRQFDKIRIQVIQLKQQNKMLKKDISQIKDNNQKSRNKLPLSADIQGSLQYRSDKNINFRKSKVQNSGLQTSLVTKLNTIQQYIGQGIQGTPYYQLLSKQFKIRFRRSCLKNKQLLFKGEGLQIGVISQYFAPNVIKLLVHITNNSEYDIKNFKIKAINPNQNKVQYQVQQIKVLSPSQQIKIPVSCVIKNYPIGPVVLLIDFTGEKKHDLRILLPVHIFKCVDIKPHKQALLNPNLLTFKLQRKICKNINSMRQYLNLQQGEQPIKIKIRHQHTNSSLLMNINLNKDELIIQYEHIEGYSNFTQYFVKTLKALLQKSN